MAYKLREVPGVIRISDGAFIADDRYNAAWQEYVAWCADGNTPQPADTPPPPTQNELDVSAAREYAKLRALVTMTPAQVQAWVSANVTNLVQAQDAITTLAVAVSILARRL